MLNSSLKPTIFSLFVFNSKCVIKFFYAIYLEFVLSFPFVFLTFCYFIINFEIIYKLIILFWSLFVDFYVKRINKFFYIIFHKNKLVINVFIFSLISYLIFYFFELPKNVFIKIFEVLILSGMGSSFFLLLMKIKHIEERRNQLQKVLSQYLRMKHNILGKMLIALWELYPREILDEWIENIFNNPKEAKKKFTEKNFKKIIENIDISEVLAILSEIETFISILISLNNELIKERDDLLFLVNNIKNIELRIRQLLSHKKNEGTPLFFDWTDESELKIMHVLYLLFCEESKNGNDPRFEKLQDKFKEYIY